MHQNKTTYTEDHFCKMSIVQIKKKKKKKRKGGLIRGGTSVLVFIYFVYKTHVFLVAECDP